MVGPYHQDHLVTSYVRIRGYGAPGLTATHLTGGETDAILCDLSKVSSIVARQPSICNNRLPQFLMSARQRRRQEQEEMVKQQSLARFRRNLLQQPQPASIASSSFINLGMRTSKRKMEQEEGVERRGKWIKCFISNLGQVIFVNNVGRSNNIRVVRSLNLPYGVKVVKK